MRRSLRALEKALAILAAQVRHISSKGSAGIVKTRRRLKASPARLKALQLHGRYMRQLKPRTKAEVKALREKKGVRVAIARARKMASK